jgi:hypothetical protein
MDIVSVSEGWERRPMSLPVGGCNRCAKAVWTASELHKGCTRTLGCVGTVVAAAHASDWEDCSACQGKGRHGIVARDRCAGAGLLFANLPLPELTLR